MQDKRGWRGRRDKKQDTTRVITRAFQFFLEGNRDKILFLLTSYTVKPDELVELKRFEETDCLKPFKLINSTSLSYENIFNLSTINSNIYCEDNFGK